MLIAEFESALASTSLAMDAAVEMQRAACERIAFLEMLLAARNVRILALETELEAEGREVERLRAGIKGMIARAA